MKDKKVLIVDDSETVRQQVAGALEKAGFSVIEAADGQEGLDCIKKTDLLLVILDVNMPRMNGLDMLERVKADPKNLDLPVIMLTTEVQESMIDRAKRAGARGWLIKPVKMDQLVSVVTRLSASVA